MFTFSIQIFFFAQTIYEIVTTMFSTSLKPAEVCTVMNMYEYCTSIPYILHVHKLLLPQCICNNISVNDVKVSLNLHCLMHTTTRNAHPRVTACAFLAFLAYFAVLQNMQENFPWKVETTNFHCPSRLRRKRYLQLVTPDPNVHKWLHRERRAVLHKTGRADGGWKLLMWFNGKTTGLWAAG